MNIVSNPIIYQINLKITHKLFKNYIYHEVCNLMAESIQNAEQNAIDDYKLIYGISYNYEISKSEINYVKTKELKNKYVYNIKVRCHYKHVILGYYESYHSKVFEYHLIFDEHRSPNFILCVCKDMINDYYKKNRYYYENYIIKNIEFEELSDTSYFFITEPE